MAFSDKGTKEKQLPINTFKLPWLAPFKVRLANGNATKPINGNRPAFTSTN